MLSARSSHSPFENLNKISDTEYVLAKKLQIGNTLLINNGRYTIYAMDYETIKVLDDNKEKKKFKIEPRLYHRLTNKIDNKELDKVKNQISELETKVYKYKLMNILSNEIYEIKFDKEKLEEMINYLLFHKYKNIKPLSDEEFVEDVFSTEIKLEAVFDNKAFILNNANSNAFIDD
jgi:transcriptional regulator NrdR family protein